MILENQLATLHNEWLKNPMTQEVLRALNKHHETHVTTVCSNAVAKDSVVTANDIKQQAAIAFNIKLMISIITNPAHISKLTSQKE